MTEKRLGRPAVDGETKTANIHVLTTALVKERAKQLAADKKLSLGEYVRRLIAADIARRDKRGAKR